MAKLPINTYIKETFELPLPKTSPNKRQGIRTFKVEYGRHTQQQKKKDDFYTREAVSFSEGGEFHQYVNGYKHEGEPIKNRELLKILKKNLPGYILNNISEFNGKKIEDLMKE